jgi:hypothetical protein
MLMDNTNWLLEILDCLILNNEAKWSSLSQHFGNKVSLAYPIYLYHVVTVPIDFFFCGNVINNLLKKIILILHVMYTHVYMYI